MTHARRLRRNFDFLLLGGLLLLSAFGVVMIYSATIDAAGLRNPVQRQGVFLVIGVTLLLLAAVTDYHLLDVLRHPISILTPTVLWLASAALSLAVRMQLLFPSQTGTASVSEASRSASASLPVPAMVAAAVLIALVFVLDRLWIQKTGLLLARPLAIAGVVGAAGATFLFLRQDPGRWQQLSPFLLPASLAALYAVDCLSFRFADALSNPLYVVTLALLGLTLAVGRVAGGAQSWLGAGAVQPSEVAKLLLIVVLAGYLSDHEQQLDRFQIVVGSLALVAVPVLLIYLQPDLGTALTLIPIWAAVIWAAGLRYRHLLALAGLCLAAMPLIWFGLQDYMRQRILLFLNPASDPDSYFNVHQALVSIGSGGWLGKGLTHGSQSQLHFLRVRHTDFIFAVTAEELGFVGALAVMGLLLFLVWRLLRIASQSRDMFGRLLAVGVAATILVQSIINIGMNLGLMPVTGLPLPFVSYGGSSLITLMVGVGLAESVAMRHRKLEFD